ncbi:prepilin peptidase [Burkholderia sp. 22PA0106]|uniref:A24 family peptidase n=1 Tax=Burkholderia sp. 22PA0106 TaxID=3237371 RepID=UPI0039C1B703
MLVLSLLMRIVVACLLAWLATVDLRTRRLPTRAVAAIAVLFPVDAVLVGMPAAEMGLHLAVALLILLAGFALFAARMLGGGDVKLAAAIFLWVGVTGFMPALTLVSVIGTIVGFISLATRRLSPSAERRGVRRWLALFSGARGVPYGVALALGGATAIVLPGVLPLLAR